MWPSDVSCHINEIPRHNAVIYLQDTAMVAVGGGEEKTLELSKLWLLECVHFL
jgi:hypothetical protein